MSLVLSALGFNSWIDSASFRGTAREVMRAIGRFVDWSTGASHERFAITAERLARATGRHITTIWRIIAKLESLGAITRERCPRRQRGDGTWRQEPNRYIVHAPKEAWRETKAVRETYAAREVEPELADEMCHDEPSRPPHKSPAQVALSVRGNVRVYTTSDKVSADELSAKLVNAAFLMSEGVSDERRMVVMNGLHELTQRSMRASKWACELGLSAGRAVGSVRAWVVKCLKDPAYPITDGNHALNALHAFMRGASEADDAHDERRLDEGYERAVHERTGKHGAQRPKPVPFVPSGIKVNRV